MKSYWDYVIGVCIGFLFFSAIMIVGAGGFFSVTACYKSVVNTRPLWFLGGILILVSSFFVAAGFWWLADKIG